MWQLRKLYVACAGPGRAAYIGVSEEKAHAFEGCDVEQWVCAVCVDGNGLPEVVPIAKCSEDDPCAGAVIDIPMRLDDLVVAPKAWVARVDAEFDALHFDVTAPATSRSS